MLHEPHAPTLLAERRNVRSCRRTRPIDAHFQSAYEVLYDVPGWPRVIHGRTDLMAQFRGYCENIELQSADKLIAHKTDNGRVVVIEYDVQGTILATGVKYNNRFCSIIKLENRKIAHWRDYMDSLAAWNALTAHTH